MVATTTGELTAEQLLWRAVLHAGPRAMLGGLTAARQHGLSGWEREVVTVLVQNWLSFAPLDGVRYFRTRRDLAAFRSPRSIPTCRVEPALLLFAGRDGFAVSTPACAAQPPAWFAPPRDSP